MTAHEWNKRHPIGTTVRYYPILGVPGEASYRGEYQTRSEAWTLGSGDPVVKITGHAGGIYLKHLEVREAMSELGKVEKTKGMEIIKFLDAYWRECDLRSLGVYRVGICVHDGDIYFDKDQVRGLVDVLNRWLETGKFSE